MYTYQLDEFSQTGIVYGQMRITYSIRKENISCPNNNVVSSACGNFNDTANPNRPLPSNKNGVPPLQVSFNNPSVESNLNISEKETVSTEANSYDMQFKLCVRNSSGLRSKLNELNKSFEQFISSFNILCFVLNDQCRINGLLEPFIQIREKHPTAWKKFGGGGESPFCLERAY